MMTETVVNVQEAPNNNMANKPQQTNQQQDSPFSWIKINLDYFKTVPGLLKIAEFILGILCMSLASPAYYGGTHFFLFVATTSFIGTLIWIFIYLLGIREALNMPINWILTELFNTGICTVFYIIAFIVQLIVSATIHHAYSHRGMYIAAGVFGLFNAGVYGFATYLLSIEWKSSRSTN
ncbi:CKLF-like MARVEL transmembrane domain-containing protein 4 [Leptinotarsa decemlineata]|uniref:CKLF-like MARVEL transmembrane domain-containing protein 4 n=1 Tax=Leptinotarsa decemlineata TaxID=7539 RepID=UPI000C2517E3|nr:CKLF-like MARVEL transmembrane domain-containing protein 8 [Leptinotarsa decemlineata]